MPEIFQTHATRDFTCLGDACEDTCCKGWGMQLTRETVDLYRTKAPELLDAVTSGEAEFVMKRDPSTDYCVKFDQGWCGVQKTYGDRFLGDACHFFPRATRALGDDAIMTIAPSCPQAVRLMLQMDAPFARSLREDARVPHSIKHYGIDGVGEAQMLALHDLFMGYVDTAANPSRAMAGIAHLATRLGMQPEANWPGAAEFFMKQVDASLAAPEAELVDALHIINALQGLMVAGAATKRPRLMAVIEDMARAIDVTLDWQQVQITPGPDTAARIADMLSAWQGFYAQVLAAPMKRYVQMQLSLTFFPFSGLGTTIVERAQVMAVRYATVQQAMMSYCIMHEDAPDETEQVRIIQTISRFMDHLADASFSLAIYKEVGWTREARLNGLLGIAA